MLSDWPMFGDGPVFLVPLWELLVYYLGTAIYQGIWFVCFVCHIEISQARAPLERHLVLDILGEPSMNRGVPRWFCNVQTYGEKVT